MRVRLRSTKLGKIRFVGHRDMARVWDRALRRAGLPLAFSGGFTPRARISFGLALPTGAESLAEYVDVELDEHRADGLARRVPDLSRDLTDVMPDGVDVTAAAVVDAGGSSLQELVTSCTWELWSDRIGPADVEAALALVGLDHLPLERERKGVRRIDDVRPLVLDLEADVTGRRLVAHLATSGRALRPSELASLAFPGVDPLDVRAMRTHQWTHHHGARREVLPQPTEMAALTSTVSA